ncbi:MAG: dynamin family protein, partial [Campylobacter sp.]
MINGEDATQKDSLKKCWGDPNKSLLQDWVDNFFDTLSNFINERSYDIDFFGFPSDYEDLEDAKNEFCKDNPEYSIKIKLVDNDIKSYKRRIKELRELFEHAQQNSLYNEFKMDETKDVFDIALSNEEEIGVVATVSSGKSTLVNAMLHKRILPAKNKATTAVVTKIFNEKSKKEFTVSANDKDGICICDNEVATYDIIDKLNNAENIKDLKLYGSIPNIKGYGLKVVLNDTPGPNNSEDEKHRALTYELINKTYKPMILYILDATKLKVDDDKKLLQYISKKMKDSGVQSKDRFIFVLNKADALDPESQDGENAEEAIKDLRKYLK